MTILDMKREEVERLVASGLMNKTMIKHYDICRAIASGMTQEQAAEKFGVTDDSYIRKIKKQRCPDCYK